MYSFIWNIPLCLLILSSSVFSHIKQLSYASQFEMSGFTYKLFWGPNSMVSPGHQSQGFQEGPLVWGRCAPLWLVHDRYRHAAAVVEGPAVTGAGFLVYGTATQVWVSHPGQETRWGNASPGRRCLPGKVDRGHLFFFSKPNCIQLY